MIKIIISFVLLSCVAYSQYPSGLLREQMRVVDLSAQEDSLIVFTVPVHSLVTKVVTYVDTTITNTVDVGIYISESGQELMTWAVGETDVIYTHHITRPDIIVSGESILVRYTSGGGAPSGRLRVWVEYVEVY